jgi:hypothetical protein
MVGSEARSLPLSRLAYRTWASRLPAQPRGGAVPNVFFSLEEAGVGLRSRIYGVLGSQAIAEHALCVTNT